MASSASNNLSDRRLNFKHCRERPECHCLTIWTKSTFLSIPSHFSYKHAIDGVLRVTREEGFRKLFNGADWASSRAVLVTVGQLCFYDVVKEKLLETGRFQDDTRTHLLSSVTAVSKYYVLVRVPLDSREARDASPLH